MVPASLYPQPPQRRRPEACPPTGSSPVRWQRHSRRSGPIRWRRINTFRGGALRVRDDFERTEPPRRDCDLEGNSIPSSEARAVLRKKSDRGLGGAKWASNVENRLAEYFPRNPAESIIAYVWAHTVPCPTTGRPTPLSPDFWLAHGKKAGREIAVALEVDRNSGTYGLRIVEGREAAEWGGSRSTYKRGGRREHLDR